MLSIIKDNPHLQAYLVNCKHCQIPFITDPRNAGRKDLGCPFGCREAIRKESARERSKEYYQSESGKIKKQYQNKKRSVKKDSEESQGTEHSPGSFMPVISPSTETLAVVSPSTLTYLQMITSLMEGRHIVMDEILCMVNRILRQLSFDNRIQKMYFGKNLEVNPP